MSHKNVSAPGHNISLSSKEILQIFDVFQSFGSIYINKIILKILYTILVY